MTPRLALAALLAAAPAAAAQQPAPERLIQVTGVGVDRTPPDTATLAFWLRGEGATPDEATRALQAKQRAVNEGVAGLLGPTARPTAGNVTVIEARGAECQDRGYNAQPRLSQGACTVTGYLATLQAEVRTNAVDRAGTAAGLMARLGASDARLQGFALSDPAAATARATAAAVADARARAEALARGAGVRLGPVVTLRDGNYVSPDIVVGANRMAAPPPPPPPSAPAPVQIEAKPRPVETRATVTVAFAILP